MCPGKGCTARQEGACECTYVQGGSYGFLSITYFILTSLCEYKKEGDKRIKLNQRGKLQKLKPYSFGYVNKSVEDLISYSHRWAFLEPSGTSKLVD